MDSFPDVEEIKPLKARMLDLKALMFIKKINRQSMNN